MTSADDMAMTWQMTSLRADVSRGTLARAGAWRRVAEAEARDYDAETSGGAWRRVECPMKTIFHRKADRRDYFSMVQSVV